MKIDLLSLIIICTEVNIANRKMTKKKEKEIKEQGAYLMYFHSLLNWFK